MMTQISAFYFLTVFSAVFCLKNAGGNITVVWTGKSQNSSDCILNFLDRTIPCSLGEHGVTSQKKEGDGYTPRGSYPIRRGFYRADRVGEVIVPTFLDMQQTQPDFGWCDGPDDDMYNMFVNIPYSASYENLWLDDSAAYDVMAVIGYNDDPVVPGLGSAIFFHVTTTYGPTAGCVAVALNDIKWVLSMIEEDTRINII
jgi:L,D-peptidoglycan transpeptidase YkuD (ErfK/YbiS/YcfS/YnhG family)